LDLPEHRLRNPPTLICRLMLDLGPMSGTGESLFMALPRQSPCLPYWTNSDRRLAMVLSRFVTQFCSARTSTWPRLRPTATSLALEVYRTRFRAAPCLPSHS